MAKRILAIIMALVLSLSLLSVEMFATFDTAPTIKQEGTTITVTTGSRTGATRYDVALLRNGTTYQSKQSASANQAITFTVSTGASYSARITAYDAAGVLDTASTDSVNVPLSSNTSYGTITIDGNTVKWTAVANKTVERYDVDYTVRLSDGTTKTRSKNAGTSLSANLDVNSGETLVSVTIYFTVTGEPRQTYGTANASSSQGGYPGQSGTQGTGNVWLNGTTLSWYGNGYGTNYTIGYSVNNGSVQRYTTTQYGATNSYNLYSLIQQLIYNYGYNTYFTFYVYYGSTVNNSNLLGYATYYGSYTGGNNNYGSGVSAYVINNQIILNWASTGAAYYIINVRTGYTSGGSYSTSNNTYTIDFVYGNSYTINVYDSNNRTVGTVTIAANGVVSGNGSYWNQGSSNNSSYVNGSNCTLSVGTTSTTVTWGSVGVGSYIVLYTNNDTNSNASITAYTTTATIPLGSSNCSSFTVNIIAPTLSTPYVGSATYTRSTSLGTTIPTTSSTNNLTLTEKSSSTTTVSWDAVDDVQYYHVVYSRLDTQVPVEDYLTKTSYDLPLGRRIGFTVYVYAVTKSNRRVTVGSATHIAGDAYPSVNSKDDDDTTTISEYVTGLKGTASSKQVLLSWNAASGNPTYTIYWKRSSSSEWKKAGTTKKKAVTIKGLNNGVTYDFKVVANGHDSGILSSLAPQSSGSTTKTAPDPAGAGTTTSSVPVITSVTGGSGSISVSWTGITNGKAYKIYVAENGSSTYKLKATVSGTSATITGLSAGTYKVRIKGTTTSMSNITSSTKWTELADCDYRSVTVK